MKTFKLLSVSIIFAIIITFNYNCATIFSGTKSTVKVDGYPESASVFSNGNYEGETPLKIKVSKKALKKGITVEIKKQGFINETVKLDRQIKGSAIIGNILFTGAIGFIFDFGTGAIYKPYPGRINYLLEKENAVTKKE